MQGSIWQQAAAWIRGGGPGQDQPSLNPQQQAILLATRREQQLDRVLGPAAQPPDAPKGTYLFGSVGSGKSALCTLFFQMLEQRDLVPLRRRMHINSAMLGKCCTPHLANPLVPQMMCLLQWHRFTAYLSRLREFHFFLCRNQQPDLETGAAA